MAQSDTQKPFDLRALARQLALVLVALAMSYPLLWLAVASLKPESQKARSSPAAA